MNQTNLETSQAHKVSAALLVARIYGGTDRTLAKTIIGNSLKGHTETMRESN